MIKFNMFIPAELAEAPPRPLKKSLNLKLRSILVAQYNKFEVWSPQVDSTLLTDEAKLLMSDRKRVEAICAKLTGLIGAICSNAADESYWDGVHTHNWQMILTYASKYSFTPDAGVIDIAYFSELICPVIGEDKHQEGWLFVPASWKIFFLNIKPFESGFRVERLPLRVLISSGKPVKQPIEQRSQPILDFGF